MQEHTKNELNRATLNEIIEKIITRLEICVNVAILQLLTKFTENGKVTSKSTKQSVSSGNCRLQAPINFQGVRKEVFVRLKRVARKRSGGCF